MVSACGREGSERAREVRAWGAGASRDLDLDLEDSVYGTGATRGGR